MIFLVISTGSPSTRTSSIRHRRRRGMGGDFPGIHPHHAAPDRGKPQTPVFRPPAGRLIAVRTFHRHHAVVPSVNDVIQLAGPSVGHGVQRRFWSRNRFLGGFPATTGHGASSRIWLITSTGNPCGAVIREKLRPGGTAAVRRGTCPPKACPRHPPAGNKSAVPPARPWGGTASACPVRNETRCRRRPRPKSRPPGVSARARTAGSRLALLVPSTR